MESFSKYEDSVSFRLWEVVNLRWSLFLFPYFCHLVKGKGVSRLSTLSRAQTVPRRPRLFNSVVRRLARSTKNLVYTVDLLWFDPVRLKTFHGILKFSIFLWYWVKTPRTLVMLHSHLPSLHWSVRRERTENIHSNDNIILSTHTVGTPPRRV